MRAILPAAAAAVVAFAATSAAARGLEVLLNHSAPLSIAGSASSVVVGNPKIADVTVVDSHTLFVSGRGYGVTDVVVVDAAGRTLWSGDVNVIAAAQGHVSVYRGGERSDLACAPTCHAAPKVDDGASGPTEAAPSAATAAATAAGNIGGASMVAHALAPS